MAWPSNWSYLEKEIIHFWYTWLCVMSWHIAPVCQLATRQMCCLAPSMSHTTAGQNISHRGQRSIMQRCQPTDRLHSYLDGGVMPRWCHPPSCKRNLSADNWTSYKSKMPCSNGRLGFGRRKCASFVKINLPVFLIHYQPDHTIPSSCPKGSRGHPFLWKPLYDSKQETNACIAWSIHVLFPCQMACCLICSCHLYKAILDAFVSKERNSGCNTKNCMSLEI